MESGPENPRRLLWGQGYLDAKERIMEPIGEVVALVDTRTKQETADAVAAARRYSEGAVAIGVMLLGVIVFMAVGVRRAVLRPIAALDAATERIAAGDLEVKAPVAGARPGGHQGGGAGQRAHRPRQADRRRHQPRLSALDREDEDGRQVVSGPAC